MLEVWAQFFGRFHPLVVHLPIGILIFGGIIHWFYIKEKPKKQNSLVKLTLLWTFLTSTFSCALGYLLSLSGEYDETMLDQHQNMGLILAIGSGVVYAMILTPYLKNFLDGIIRWIYLAFILLIGITGHLGGNLTHGEGYLTQFTPPPFRYWMGMDTLEFLSGEERKLDISKAIIYEDIIEPVLKQKCWSCHNDKKQKGNLRMDQFELLMKGGKNGPIIVQGNASNSEIINRVTLEESHDKHMPPKGKLGLTSSEIKLLEWWINDGAKKDLKYTEANFPVEIKEYLTSLTSEEKPLFSPIILEEIEPLSENILTKYRSLGILLNPLSQENNHLDFNAVNYLNLINQDLSDIEELANHLVYLKIARTSINDSAGIYIAKLKNLIKLDVSGNQLGDDFVNQISGLENLEVLNLYGTQVSDQSLPSFGKLSNLKKLFLYQTKVSEDGLKELKRINPSLDVNNGMISDLFIEKDSL